MCNLETVRDPGTYQECSHLGYYNYTTNSIELNLIWPAWKYIKTDTVPTIIINAVIHEELHHAMRWAIGIPPNEAPMYPGGYTNYFNDHYAINRIFEILNMPMKSDPNQHFKAWDKYRTTPDMYYQLIADRMNTLLQ